VVFGTFPMKRKDWKEQIDSQAEFNKYENYTYTKACLNELNTNNIFRYNYNNELKPIYLNNTIYAIDDNTAVLEHTVRLIRLAKEFIHFETFIIHDGFFFRIVMTELIKKAKEGVKVRFLYD
jgi:cardiolipin synthase